MRVYFILKRRTLKKKNLCENRWKDEAGKDDLLWLHDYMYTRLLRTTQTILWSFEGLERVGNMKTERLSLLVVYVYSRVKTMVIIFCMHVCSRLNKLPTDSQNSDKINTRTYVMYTTNIIQKLHNNFVTFSFYSNLRAIHFLTFFRAFYGVPKWSNIGAMSYIELYTIYIYIQYMLHLLLI